MFERERLVAAAAVLVAEAAIGLVAGVEALDFAFERGDEGVTAKAVPGFEGDACGGWRGCG